MVWYGARMPPKSGGMALVPDLTPLFEVILPRSIGSPMYLKFHPNDFFVMVSPWGGGGGLDLVPLRPTPQLLSKTRGGGRGEGVDPKGGGGPAWSPTYGYQNNQRVALIISTIHTV